MGKPGRFIFSLAFVWLIITSIAGSARAQLPGQEPVSAALNLRQVQSGQQAVIAVVLDVGHGLHAQSHTPLSSYLIPLVVEVNASPEIAPAQPIYPTPEIVQYPLLGKLSVYTGRVIVYVPVRIEQSATPGKLNISGTITYQICNDKSCFAPQHQNWEIHTAIVGAGQTLEPANAELFKGFNPAQLASAPSSGSAVGMGFDVLGWHIGAKSYLPAFIAAFLIGIIFNVMPCVLPVVPLKAMGFYQVAQQNRVRSMILGAVFSAGIVTAFAVLAILVLVLRWFDWGKLFSYPLFTGAIVIVLVALALQTFGFFAFILPSGIYQLAPSHDTILGNFLFGIFTAILSTPCTFGMFLGLLIWASAQPSIIGVAVLMASGVGMASPYWLLSAFPALARRLPRSGVWTEIVEQMMGFLLLATAVYFARSLMPEGLRGPNFWWAIFTVIAASGIFLIVRTLSLTRRRGAVIAAVVATILIVAPSLWATLRLSYVPIPWEPYTPARLAAARSANRPVVIDFTATWCGNCQALEATVFVNPAIVKTIRQQNVLALRADVTASNAPGWSLLRQLNPVGAIPLTVIYLPERGARQLAGIYSAGDLLDVLK